MSELVSLVYGFGRSLKLQNCSRLFRTSEEQAGRIIGKFHQTQASASYPYSELYKRFDNVVVAGVAKNSKTASSFREGVNYYKAFEKLKGMLPDSITKDGHLLSQNLENHVQNLNGYINKLQIGDSVPIHNSIKEIIDNIQTNKPNLYFYSTF